MGNLFFLPIKLNLKDTLAVCQQWTRYSLHSTSHATESGIRPPQ